VVKTGVNCDSSVFFSHFSAPGYRWLIIIIIVIIQSLFFISNETSTPCLKKINPAFDMFAELKKYSQASHIITAPPFLITEAAEDMRCTQWLQLHTHIFCAKNSSLCSHLICAPSITFSPLVLSCFLTV